MIFLTNSEKLVHKPPSWPHQMYLDKHVYVCANNNYSQNSNLRLSVYFHTGLCEHIEKELP